MTFNNTSNYIKFITVHFFFFFTTMGLLLLTCMLYHVNACNNTVSFHEISILLALKYVTCNIITEKEVLVIIHCKHFHEHSTLFAKLFKGFLFKIIYYDPDGHLV